MCLSNIKYGTASRPIRSRAENIHPLTRKNTCIRAGVFRYRGEWYLQSSDLSHRISDAKRKSDHSQMVATRKHKHESPSPKYKKHLEHLQYSTPPLNEHNTRIRTFTHIFFAEILARRYNENFLPFYSEPP